MKITDLISLVKIGEKIPKESFKPGGYLREGVEWRTMDPEYLAVAVLIKKETVRLLQSKYKNELPEKLRDLVLSVDLGQSQAAGTNHGQLDLEKDLLQGQPAK